MVEEVFRLDGTVFAIERYNEYRKWIPARTYIEEYDHPMCSWWCGQVSIYQDIVTVHVDVTPAQPCEKCCRRLASMSSAMRQKHERAKARLKMDIEKYTSVVEASLNALSSLFQPRPHQNGLLHETALMDFIAIRPLISIICDYVGYHGLAIVEWQKTNRNNNEKNDLTSFASAYVYDVSSAWIPISPRALAPFIETYSDQWCQVIGPPTEEREKIMITFDSLTETKYESFINPHRVWMFTILPGKHSSFMKPPKFYYC